MDFWEWYDRNLAAAKEEDVPVYELEWLILKLTGLDKLDLRLRSQNISHKISAELFTQIDQLWQQRLCDRIPVQYLAGSVTWRNLELQVSPAVLIPRPETELIIDIVVENCQAPSYQQGIWVDLGTGSGAIAIAMAQQFPLAQVHAIDCSADALAIAKLNASQNHLNHQPIQFHQGSWFEPLANLNLQNQLAGMISNPPYIPSREVLNLQPEVTNHEPHLALDGGEDGLDDLQELVNTAPQYLMSAGFWIVELMAGQAPILRSQLAADGRYTNIQSHQDYAGIERFVSAFMK
jgi:release factor glutamine methyltransferase